MIVNDKSLLALFIQYVFPCTTSSQEHKYESDDDQDTDVSEFLDESGNSDPDYVMNGKYTSLILQYFAHTGV